MSDQAEIDQKLIEIKRAIRERQPDVARQLLIEVLKVDPRNAEAWFVSSFLIKDPVAQVEAAQRALAINPNFSAAQERLNELQARLSGPTSLASVYEEEREESAPIAATPPPEPTPPPNIFRDDEATVITERPRQDDAPFEPAFDAPRRDAASDVVAPSDATSETPIPDPTAPAWDEPTVIGKRPTADIFDTPSSEAFPFDELSTDEPNSPISDDFSFLDEVQPPPPAPVEPEPTRIAVSPFFDLVNEPPDSPRAVADADKLLENQPFEPKSKRGKGKTPALSLDQPYDPSVKQPRLPSTRAGASQSRKKNPKQAAVKAARQAQQNRQEQAITLLLLTLLLAAVLIIAAVVVLRSRGGLENLFPAPTQTSAPVIVPSSTPLLPTTTLVPTSGPSSTPVPPTSAPVIAPTTASTVLPPTQTPTPTTPAPSRTPTSPPASGTLNATSPPTAQTTAVGLAGPASGGTEVAAASDAALVEGFRAGINQAKALFRETTFSPLSPANAGQLIPLTRVAIPGLFSALFHDGRPTLIFQTGGFSSRPSATFAIASLLDDQPLMRVSMQTAAALGAVRLSQDEKTLVSISAARITVVDPQTARILLTINSQNTTNALSADGQRAATASNNDGTISIWNLETGQLDHAVTLDGMTPERGPNSLVFSPDGSALAVGGCDGSIRLIDTADGAATTLQAAGETFDCYDVVTFTADGQYVLATGNNGFGRFRTADDDALTPLTYPGLAANPRPKVALSGDSRLVAAANNDFLIVWDFATGETLVRQKLEAETSRVDGVTFSADNRFVVTATRGSFDGLTWWGIAAGPLAAQATATIEAQTARATATADALAAALVGSGRLVFARPLDNAQFGLFVYAPGSSSLPQLAALDSSGGQWLYSFTTDGKTLAYVRQTDGAPGIQVIGSSAASTQDAPLLADAENPVLSPDGRILLFRSSDGACGMATVADGQSIPFAERVDCTLTSAVWSPDSASLAVEQVYSSPTESNSAATATRVLVMQVSADGVSAPVMIGPDSPRAGDPAFRPDGTLTYLMLDVVTKHYALFTSAAGSNSATLVAAIPGNTPYHAHVWSPDGARVALVEATAPEQVLILDAKGSLIARVPGDELYTQVDALAWSTDGRFLAASRRTPDRAQTRIFIIPADGTSAVPLVDGLDARWLP